VNIETAAARLEALGHPTRLLIYRALVRAGDPGLPVGALQSMLDVGPSTLSHHIKALLGVGLIEQERRGTSLICRTHYDVMDALVAFLVAECCVNGARPAPARSDTEAACGPPDREDP
jgi:DNA-binding transcriptional ArsR family regulator